MSSTAKIEHELSTISLRPDGILEFRHRDGAYLTLDIAREQALAALEIAGDRAPLPTLIVMGHIRGITREARDFYAAGEEHQRLSSRVALVVSSPMGRLLANLYLTLSPLVIQSRAFTDEGSAVGWLVHHTHGLARRAWFRF